MTMDANTLHGIMIICGTIIVVALWAGLVHMLDER